MRLITLFAALVFAYGVSAQKDAMGTQQDRGSVSLHVLGTVQDAGSPHISCAKMCCAALFAEGNMTRKVVSLGVVDARFQKTFLFEATPDLAAQLRALRDLARFKPTDIPNGVFLTHAHIGHYTGLMYFGKEAANTHALPVFAMPKMIAFLKDNGPWGQLVDNKNIALKALSNGEPAHLTEHLQVIPLTVPHRDEYSETVGYKIIGPNKSALFIPDIDKWEKWKTPIIAEIGKVDYAFLDATFFDGEEINNRDISEIPHPFVIESMALFKTLPAREKEKVHFIHFNHTNPILNPESIQTKQVEEAGYKVARQGMVFQL